MVRICGPNHGAARSLVSPLPASPPARPSICAEVKELQLKYEQKMKLLRDDLELRRKVEILEIEERKNNHINEYVRPRLTAAIR